MVDEGGFDIIGHNAVTVFIDLVHSFLMLEMVLFAQRLFFIHQPLLLATTSPLAQYP
jgi:hypothetical protein